MREKTVRCLRAAQRWVFVCLGLVGAGCTPPTPATPIAADRPRPVDVPTNGRCEGVPGMRCHGLPPPEEREGGVPPPELDAAVRVSSWEDDGGTQYTRQVDPGPFQIWEYLGNTWVLEGIIYVTADSANPMMLTERWAFSHYDASTNVGGYRHPRFDFTTAHLAFIRLTTSPTAKTDAAFQLWAGNQLRALAVAYAPQTAKFDNPNIEYMNAAVTCPATLYYGGTCGAVALSATTTSRVPPGLPPPPPLVPSQQR